jgi:hypothetical protein
MESRKTNFSGITIYFHLVPLLDAKELLLLAGRGEIHDLPTAAMPYELFLYFLDTFQLIPTQRATMRRVPMERPVIAAEGAGAARRIFAGWKQIFLAGGEDIILTVGAGFSAATESVKRDEIVSLLSTLEAFTNLIEGGEKVIYFSDTPDYRKVVSRSDKRRAIQVARVV